MNQNLEYTKVHLPLAFALHLGHVRSWYDMGTMIFIVLMEGVSILCSK